MKQKKYKNVRSAEQVRKPQPRLVITHQDIKEVAHRTEGYIKSYMSLVEEYSAKMRHSKMMMIIWLLLCIFFSAVLIFNINIGMQKVWNTMLALSFFLLAMMSLSEYVSRRNGVSYWNRQIKEDAAYLQDLKERLAKT